MQITRDFFVDFRSVDADLSIRNSGILGMFEDIACLHGTRCGENIAESELRWLLVGYRVNIVRRPKYGAEVQVVTWSKDYRNVTATREFEMRDADGQLLVTGWSNWARVNIRTKELVKLTDEAMAPYQSEPERTNFGKAPRVTEPAAHDSSTKMVIDWRWMDNNRHMHNSYYLDVAEHILPDHARAQLAECSFDVVYKQEITENAQIVCLFTETEQNWTVTFKSSDLSTLHAIVVFHRPQQASGSDAGQSGNEEKAVAAEPDAQSDCAAQVSAVDEKPEKPRRRGLFSRRTICE